MDKLFRTLPHICFGIGSINVLKENIKQFHGKRVLILIEPVEDKMNILKQIKTMVKQNQMTYHIHYVTKLKLKLTDEDSIERTKYSQKVDVMIGIGGTLLLNFTKFIAISLNNKNIFETVLQKQPLQKGIPTILIPTTITSGFEAAPHIMIDQTQEQLSVRHRYFAPSTIIYDPNLTRFSLPYERFSQSILTLIKALESYYLLKEENFLLNFPLKAITLIFKNMIQVTYQTNDLEAQAALTKAGMYLGIIKNVYPNQYVFHCFIKPLQQVAHIPKEMAVAVMLPYILEMYRKLNHTRGKKIVSELGLNLNDDDHIDLYLKARLANLIRTIGFPTKLASLNITKEDLTILAKYANDEFCKMNDFCIKWNEQDFKKLYENAYFGKIKSFFQ